MKIEYSVDAICTLLDTINSYRGYTAQLRRYDNDDGLPLGSLELAQDIVIVSLDHEGCSLLLLHYYDYDDETGGPLHPTKTIDLWALENEDLVLYIY